MKGARLKPVKRVLIQHYFVHNLESFEGDHHGVYGPCLWQSTLLERERERFNMSIRPV